MKQISVAKIEYYWKYASIDFGKKFDQSGDISLIDTIKRISYFKSTGKISEIYLINAPINKPYYISFFENQSHTIRHMIYGFQSVFHPYSISFDSDKNPEPSWLFNTPTYNHTYEVNHWLKERNIIVTYENHEIPDEHKTEFKLRFL